jgi:hypothetical protein
MKQKAIIVDLDGTLANCEHRRHFVDGTDGKKDWKSFYEAIEKDTVNEWCKKLIERFWFILRWDDSETSYEILLVSGRPDKYMDLTMDWLDSTEVGQWCVNPRDSTYNIFMRKDGDFRDDTIIKEEIYREYIEPFYDVLFAIDDRKKVVNMWRRLGIIALHCAEGDF